MTSFEFDNFDIIDDGYFCGWNTSTNNPDSLQFEAQHLVKIVKPNTESKSTKSNRNKSTNSPYSDQCNENTNINRNNLKHSKSKHIHDF